MRNVFWGFGVLALLLVSGFAFAQDETAGFGTVSGTVSYVQRIALPEGAEILVELADVSRADAPSKVIASQLILANGRQVPIPYNLSYDTASVREGGTYTVSAKIYVDGVLRWTSMAAYPVGNNGEFTADIDVEQVALPTEATEAPETATFGTVTGTITYPQRIALPDNAVVSIELQDTSRADAPAFVLASQQFVTRGRQVPLSFALNYDTSSIAVNGRYAVRATIRVDDELVWTSDTVHPVISNDVYDVEVTLVQVG